MRKRVMLCLCILLGLILLASVAASASIDRGEASYAKLTANGESNYYDLRKNNKEVTVCGVTVNFERGRAFVESSDCTDKICVNTGVLDSIGETAVCLPNGVVVTLISEQQYLQESKGKSLLFSESFIDTFDTVVTLTAYTRSKEEFDTYYNDLHESFSELSEIFDAFYEYDGKNNICTVNKNAGVSPVTVPDSLAQALVEMNGICIQTNGCTDMTYGALTALWREYIDGNSELPDSTKTQEALSHCGQSLLSVDGNIVYLADKEAALDVGACAKGFAAEKTAEELEKSGLTDFCINAGGNVVARGRTPAANGWSVGIENPFGDGSVYTAVIKDKCVVTSGNYRRYRDENKVRYSHLIDLKTGIPSQRFASVSVICENSAEGDAFSTALFCMSLEEGKSFAEEKNLSVIWVTNDGEVIKKFAH